jgi:class 3 adenylate cyclase
MASFCRLILFDKRGTGLSDRVSGVRPLEERMDDVRAVMDAAGSARAALVGISEGGAMSLLFAATHPERTSSLVVYGAYPGRGGPPPDELKPVLAAIEDGWGRVSLLDLYAPSRVGDPPFEEWWLRMQRLSASPGAVAAIVQMSFEIDVRHVLPTIRVPTLVLHRTGDRVISVEEGRLIARSIPGAKYVELPGEDHAPFVGDADLLVDEIEEFLTGTRAGVELDRVLATVLFTDIVGSTEQAAELGDARWRERLDSYYRHVREEVSRFRGREIGTAGDGFFATFDGPARAIRCACRIREAMPRLGLRVRAGLHTGECELIGDDVGGIAVHLGARVAQCAGAGDVLVSTTVKDLVAGSGLSFKDRGVQVLKGIPGEWQLYSVEA